MEKEFEAIQTHYGEEVARLKAQQRFQEQQFSLFVRNSIQKTRLNVGRAENCSVKNNSKLTVGDEIYNNQRIIKSQLKTYEFLSEELKIEEKAWRTAVSRFVNNLKPLGDIQNFEEVIETRIKRLEDKKRQKNFNLNENSGN